MRDYPIAIKGALDTMATRPNIFEFIDYTKFLTAWREAEKERNSGLTHEYICAKLGQKNRTYFSDIEKGRKIIGGRCLTG